MNNSFALCWINSKGRAEKIGGATRRVIYGAPGATPDELAALIQAHERLEENAVTLLVDLDWSTINAGYWGQVQPNQLQALDSFGKSASVASGLRLGLLVVDDETFVFAPTPQRIEQERETSAEPNALRLNAEMTELFLSCILAPREAVSEPRPPITSKHVKEIQNALKENKPIAFEQVRVLDVLRERLKIIQFEVRGYKIEQRSLQLPEDVIAVLGSTKKEINQRLRASWQLFQRDMDAGLHGAQEEIKTRLEEFKDKPLRSLGHYGYGLVGEDQADFDKAWQEFQGKQVEEYRVLVMNRVGAMIEQSKDLLRELLLDRIQSGRLIVPTRHTLVRQTDEERAKSYVDSLIRSVKWPTPEQVAEGIVIKVRQYDVTEQLLNDQEFVKKVEEAFECKLEDLLKSHESEKRAAKLLPDNV